MGLHRGTPDFNAAPNPNMAKHEGSACTCVGQAVCRVLAQDTVCVGKLCIMYYACAAPLPPLPHHLLASP